MRCLLALFLLALSLSPAVAAKKYWYCVIKPERPPRCETCWSYVGGEGGRVSCGVTVGPGSVRYGKCEERRNESRCWR